MSNLSPLAEIYAAQFCISPKLMSEDIIPIRLVSHFEESGQTRMALRNSRINTLSTSVASAGRSVFFTMSGRGLEQTPDIQNR